MSRPSRKFTHPLTRPPLPAGNKDDRPRPDPQKQRLRDRAKVDSHLNFIRELLKKYQLDKASQPDLHNGLGRIEVHESEHRLFLGVVGEFSSGKSTLLNALLRDDLLTTDILQGTTSAATILSHGEKLTVRIRWLRSHFIIEAFKFAWWLFTLPFWLFSKAEPTDRDSLRLRIHKHSAIEEHACKVAQVEVTHPAECLRNGMVIVDLPGTNAENPRHGNVTAAALTDFCDAAVIVIPAEAPGSETLWAFLEHHLEPDVLRRCIFVINKIDLIRPREREKLVNNVVSRLRRDLNIDRPRVLVTAPERVLEAEGVLPPPDDLQYAMTAEEKAHWTEQFRKAEGFLWATLHEQKLLLQVERLTRLLGDVLSQLTGILSKRQEEHRQRHEALQRGLAEVPNLPAFVAEARSRHCDTFGESIGPIVSAGFSAIRQIQKSMLQEIANAVFSASNRQELQTALEYTAPALLSAGQADLSSLLRAMVADLEGAAEKEHRVFHAMFQKMYRNLATLGGKVNADGGGLDWAATNSLDYTAGAQSAALAANVASLRQGDMWNSAGGAGVGAVIGTIFLPGAGTILGGLLGGIWGWLSGPSHQEVQQHCWNQLEQSLLEGFTQFDEQAKQYLITCAENIHTMLSEQIGRYAEQYRRLVEEMIARDRKEAQALAQFQQQIQRDLDLIRQRREALEEARAYLRTL